MAGIQSALPRNPNVPPHWMVCFETSDADGVAVKAKELGGKEYPAPMSMGKMRMAVLADAQRATFSIIQAIRLDHS